ncbi:MAG: recombinase [Chloroflexi bacterium]|nr:MAG: recombinase [Chloroflexota bacterium]
MDPTLLTSFERHLFNQDRSVFTIRGYLADLKHFSDWFEQTNGEQISPQAVTPTDIRAYRQYLQVIERRKASTINRRLAALSAYLDWAVQTGQIEKNPRGKIKSVKQEEPAVQALDKKQQYALQRAIEKNLQVASLRYPKRKIGRQRDASLVIFLLNTGLRLAELLALQLDDVEISERKGRVLVRQGKNNRERSVPLNAAARKALQDWLNVRPQKETRFIWIAVEDESERLTPRSVQRVLKRLGQEAGIPDLHPHLARHTFARNLVDSGVGLEKVARLLGHSNLNTTRIYVTPSEHDLELAVDTLSL